MSVRHTTKPLLITVIGLPGAGKSFFARRFAETFNAPLVSFDEIRSGLFRPMTYTPSEDVTVARVAGLQLRELLKTKKTIVIDGGHSAKVSRIELGRVARLNGYAMLVVWVQVSESIAKERSMQRSTRRSDDQFNRSLNSVEFTSSVKKFTPPTVTESCVVISGRHAYNTQAHTILKHMVVPDDATQNTPHTTPLSRASRPIPYDTTNKASRSGRS